MFLKYTFILLVLMFLLVGCSREGEDITYSRIGDKDASESFKMFTLNEISNGEKLWDLESVSSDMYSSQNLIKLKKPVINFYKKSESNSKLVSDKAIVYSDTRNMIFEGNVYVECFKDEITLKTESLTYNNGINKISSDEFITIERVDSITTGIGFESDPNLEEMIIKKDVKIIEKGN